MGDSGYATFSSNINLNGQRQEEEADTDSDQEDKSVQEANRDDESDLGSVEQDTEQNRDETDLHKAVSENNIDEVRDLFENGMSSAFDIDAKNNNGSTALHLAVEGDCTEIVHLLLENGANIDVRDDNGDTPLLIAFKNYRKELAETLLKNKVNICAQDNSGNTVLHFAIGKNRVDYVQSLFETNNETNKNRLRKCFSTPNKQGNTPIMLLDMKCGQSKARWEETHQKMNHLVNLLKRGHDDSTETAPKPKRPKIEDSWNGTHETKKSVRTKFHGPIFQVKLTMLFVNTSIDEEHEFYLGSEVSAAGDFDDIVIRYDENGWKLRFLQAKHALIESNRRITFSELESATSDFSIGKYYKSFRKLIRNKLFEGPDDLSHIEQFAIITNIDFDLDPIETKYNKNGEENKIRMKQITRRKLWKNFFQEKYMTSDDKYLFVEGRQIKINSFREECYDDIKKEIKKILRLKEFTKDDESQMTKFLEKFVIITNYPSEHELDEIMTKKLGEKFDMFNANFLYGSMFTEMIGFLKFYDKGRAKFYTPKEGKDFFAELKSRVYTLMISGLSLANTEKLDSYGVSFEEDSLLNTTISKIEEFLVDNKRFLLHMSTENTKVCAIKIRQILGQNKKLQRKFEYLKSRIGGYIFTNAQQLLESKQMFETSFFSSEESPPLLVIECPDEKFDQFSILLNWCTCYAKARKVLFIANSKLKSETGVTKDERVGYRNLTSASKEKIRDKEVTFQGNRIPLIQLMSDNVASKVIDSPNCLAPFLSDEIIKIGSDDPFSSYGYVQDYYIDRNVREQWIKSDILQEIEENVLFFISGAVSEIGKINIDQRLIHSWSSKASYANGIVLAPSDQCDAKKIFTKLRKNHTRKSIYWLECRLVNAKNKRKGRRKKVETRLYWKAFTSSNALTMHRFIENSIDRSVIGLNESNLIKATIDQKMVIIANDPGFGKSTFLTSLAIKMRNQENTPPPWIVRIDLHKYSKPQMKNNLRDTNFTSNTKAAVKFLTDIAVPDETNELERKLFEIGFQNYKGKQSDTFPRIVALFDGFDEISPNHKTNTTGLIKAINNTNNAQIWIATRKDEKDYLENDLLTPAFTLDSFTRSDQKSFLNKFWRSICTVPKKLHRAGYRPSISSLSNGRKAQKGMKINEIKEKFSKNADRLIEKANPKNDIPNSYSITEIPFNLKILAELVYDRNFELGKIDEMVDVDMYKELIDAKFNEFKKEKCGSSNENLSTNKVFEASFKVYREIHQKLALKQIFTAQEMVQLREDEQDNLNKIGFLKENSFEFIFYIFAEYFVGEYLANNLRNEDIKDILFEHVLCTRNYTNICKFFKHSLKENNYGLLRKTLSNRIIKLSTNEIMRQKAPDIATEILNLFITYPKNFQLKIARNYVAFAVAKIPNKSPNIIPDNLLTNEPDGKYELYKKTYRNGTENEIGTLA